MAADSVSDPVETIARFGRELRAAGLPVGPDRVAALTRAAALLPPGELYWAGRATLLSRPEQIEVYDAVFGAFFGPPVPPSAPPISVRVRAEVEEDVGLASPVELLREKSFARCSREELSQLAGLMAQIDLAVPRRRTRRREPARAGVPDLRRTLRRSFRTGGDPVERAWRRRRRRTRRLILLLDVSGSMDAYSRALVIFAHAALRADRRWEAFCFGTRLTRVTRQLEGSDPDAALTRAAAEVVDWDGGTRIGEALKRFLDEHGHAGLARGAVVVLCSDGLEVGDPELLAEQMGRLHRLAYRVVWLNPLKEDPAYEPLARGMKAALPHVDHFASGHSLASLEDVAAALSRW
ncbi:MAG TPA: VWA domain-containing protein [Gaiellaceae bacterium]|nr:VWA domain-containing protein [Gaiellaceae bacterium]